MAQYAARTDVTSEKSRSEIERTLQRYGATSFAYGTDDDLNAAMIGFKAQGRQIRFVLTMPSRTERRFTHHAAGPRTASAAENLYEQAVRQKWRALLLIVKAKLEAVESGIVTFEQEFLPHIIMPGGKTVYESVAAGIEAAYVSGKVSPLLQIEGAV